MRSEESRVVNARRTLGPPTHHIVCDRLQLVEGILAYNVTGVLLCALPILLGDKNFVLTAISLREFRSYEGTYIDLGRRLHFGLSAFDNTQFFYASPYDLQASFFREGAFATQRLRGAVGIAQYPLDKFHRLDLQAGVINVREGFANAEAEQLAREAAAQQGAASFFLNSGTIAPISLSLVAETTRFR